MPVVNDKFKCNPVCNNTCLNGYCVKPNTCKCNDGFGTDSEDKCVPICRALCLYRDCPRDYEAMNNRCILKSVLSLCTDNTTCVENCVAEDCGGIFSDIPVIRLV